MWRLTGWQCEQNFGSGTVDCWGTNWLTDWLTQLYVTTISVQYELTILGTQILQKLAVAELAAKFPPLCNLLCHHNSTVQCLLTAAVCWLLTAAVCWLLTAAVCWLVQCGAVQCVVMAHFEPLLGGHERQREREYVQLTTVAAEQLGSDVHLNYL